MQAKPKDKQNGGDGDTKPDRLSLGELGEKYGFAKTLIASDEELTRLFRWAVKQPPDLPFEAFLAKLKQTTWWQESSQPARDAYKIEFAGDSTWETVTLPNAVESVKDVAASLGVELGSGDAANLARQKLYNGWDDEKIMSILVRQNVGQGDSLQGSAAATEQGLRDFIRDNGLSYDDAWIRTMTARILDPNDRMDKATVYGQVLERAKTRYPSIADQLTFSDAGVVTVKSAMSPYVEMLKSTWGVNDVDVNDPILKKALTFQDAKGQFTLKSLYQVEREARQDTRFRQSTQGRQLMSSFADSLSRQFGLVG